MPLKLHINMHTPMRWNYALWLVIVLVSACLQLADWVPAWRFDRTLIDGGAVWLLLSGHGQHVWPMGWNSDFITSLLQKRNDLLAKVISESTNHNHKYYSPHSSCYCQNFSAGALNLSSYYAIRSPVYRYR